jgi:hypothetical protein
MKRKDFRKREEVIEICSPFAREFVSRGWAVETYAGGRDLIFAPKKKVERYQN